MRRTKRRLWTIGISAIASLVILLALAVGGFRILVLIAPGYRQQLVQAVSTAIDRPVAIRSINLTWRGLHPSLDLTGVTLLGDDKQTPLLRLDEMNVSPEWPALLTGQLRLAELRLVGPSITIERLADGSLRLSGIDSTEPLTMADVQEFARQADKVGRFVVAKGQIFWVDVEDPHTFQRVSNIEAIYTAGDGHHRLKGNATLPGGLGGDVSIDVTAMGDLANLAALKSEAKISAKDLHPGAWLQDYLVPGTRITGKAGKLDLDSEWLGIQLRKGNASLSTGALQAEHGGRTQELWHNLKVNATVTAQQDGWRADLGQIAIEHGSTIKPETMSGFLQYQNGTEVDGPLISGALASLQLEEVAAWLRFINLHDQAWLAELNPAGRLEDISFHYQQRQAGTPAYGLQCRLLGTSIQPVGNRPGVTALSATLDASEAGGQMKVDIKQGQLLEPHVFDHPLPIQSLAGQLSWQRNDPDWRLQGKDLKWQGPGDVAGTGNFLLQLPASGASPVIDLDTSFAAGDIGAIKPFIPHASVLHETVRAWLARAVQKGKVTRGEFKLQGSLEEFPYTHAGENGLFRIDFDIKDGVLDYVPGWPRVEDISALIVFQGHAMHISNGSGRILGLPQTDVTADIDNFNSPKLAVHGKSSGDAGRMLSFLSESPLRKNYQPLVEALKLQGPALLDLNLLIPLEELENSDVHGIVTLDGQVRLDHAKLPEPVTALAGQVAFDREGLSAQDLRGELMGLKLAMQLSPVHDTDRQMTRLSVQTQMAFPRDAEKLGKLIPERWLQHLNGSSQWQADMLFDSSASPSKLHMQSDLIGLQTSLPAPLGKSADEVKPMTVLLDTSHETGMRADLNYAGIVSAAMLLAEAKQGWTIQSATLHLGSGVAALPTVPGIWVEGALPDLNLDQWRQVMASGPEESAPAAASPASAASDTLPAAFKGVDVRLGRLQVVGQIFPDIRLQLARTDADWLLTTTSPAVEGVVRWPLKGNARPVYRADLTRLILHPPPAPPPAKPGVVPPEKIADKPVEKPMDPSQYPGVSLRCGRVRLSDQELGNFTLEVQPVPQGLNMSSVAINGDAGQMRGVGDWTRRNGQSAGHLTMQASSGKIRELMTALGYSPSLQAEKAKISFDIDWIPSAAGLVPASINGSFRLDMENGALLAVSPGAGRVLGLLNFFALPRRLTLDFRDVVSEGYTFDQLHGSFQIARGDAYTANLKMEGPAAQMKIKGHVGLADHSYNQIVTIQPQVSSGVAIAATALGGPAVGAMLLVVQQLFKKPLGQVSEIVYHLGGTWDNPVIEKPDNSDKPEPAKAKPAR